MWGGGKHTRPHTLSLSTLFLYSAKKIKFQPLIPALLISISSLFSYYFFSVQCNVPGKKLYIYICSKTYMLKNIYARFFSIFFSFFRIYKKAKKKKETLEMFLLLYILGRYRDKVHYFIFVSLLLLLLCFENMICCSHVTKKDFLAPGYMVIFNELFPKFISFVFF